MCVRHEKLFSRHNLSQPWRPLLQSVSLVGFEFPSACTLVGKISAGVHPIGRRTKSGQGAPWQSNTLVGCTLSTNRNKFFSVGWHYFFFQIQRARKNCGMIYTGVGKFSWCTPVHPRQVSETGCSTSTSRGCHARTKTTNGNNTLLCGHLCMRLSWIFVWFTFRIPCFYDGVVRRGEVGWQAVSSYAAFPKKARKIQIYVMQ